MPLPPLAPDRANDQTAGITVTEWVRESAPRITQVAEHGIAIRRDPLPHPADQVVEGACLFGHAELAVPANPVDEIGRAHV